MSDSTGPVPTPLPEELFGHMRDMDPRSFEFRQDFDVLNQMAKEEGHTALTLEQIFPPVEVTPPSNYKSELIVPNGAEIPRAQFNGIIHSLTGRGDILADEHRLVTDSNQEIRVVDLRPQMTRGVRGAAPVESQRQEALDRSFYQDLRFMLSNAGQRPRRSVSGVGATVGYSRAGNNLERAYWMPVSVVKPVGGVLTIARLGDAKDKPSERDLYQTMFGLKLQI